MDKHPKIRRYLKDIEKKLSGYERSQKRSIVNEIEEHLKEKFQQLEEANGSEISSDDVKKILKQFGEPEEIASEYKRQLSDESESPYAKKKSPTKYIILPIVALAIVTSIILAGLLLIGEEEKEYNNTIHEGVGLDSIKIGDDLDKITGLYGEPENRFDSDDTIWLGYREKEGVDFLLNKQTEEVIEIRFNPGFLGSLENGLSIGSMLDEVLNLSDGALTTVKINLSEAQNYSMGWDRVLYEVIDGTGETVSYKFIDAKKGILFWFDSNGISTQIVVFNPY